MRHKDENKIKALHAAVIDTVIEDGYQNLSVAKIAKRAGVSAATLYIYYADKQALLSAVYLAIKDQIDGELFKHQAPERSIEAQFKLALHNYADALRRYPREAAVMRIFNANPALISPVAFEAGMARAQPLAALCTQGVAQQAMRAVAPELFIAFTFTPLDSIAEASFRSGQPLAEATVNALIEMAWAACRFA